MEKQGPFVAVITRRSGRRSRSLRVTLEKPPEQYLTGEALTIQMDGRNIPAHVQIPVSDGNENLYVC